MIKTIFFYILSLVIFSHSALARPMGICQFLFSSDYRKLKKIHRLSSPKVELTNAHLEHHFDNIQKTLSGNLSTVRRIENKWKTGYTKAQGYVEKLIHGEVLTTSSRNIKTKFQNLVKEISQGNHGKLIQMRDLPPPPGAVDNTFTYYTKSISAPNGGKHQFRFRTYVREIDTQKLSHKIVYGYLENGQIIGVSKINGKFKIQHFDKTAEGLKLTSSQTNLSLIKFKKFFNNMDTPKMYAYPHGKGIKMEVKSRIPDEVKSDFLNNMTGQPFVQKLDVPITMDQVQKLFGQAAHTSRHYTTMVEEVKDQIMIKARNKYGDIGVRRVNAFFELYNDALKINPQFNRLAGSTGYQRYAFELPIPDKIGGKAISIQTTFDYNQGTRFVYGTNGKLQNPIDVFEHQTKLTSIDTNPLHVEFKAPQKLVEDVVRDPNSVSPTFRRYIKAFNDSKPDDISRGKFNFIMNDY